ncbi:uncharacterized protein LOC143622698 [Bidens hawaiensis]|uniref:uncharacterized protein LOC143622698 n=1 Tax=Bidens hawaiensis TaxID=980011 RepID=UPI0040495249
MAGVVINPVHVTGLVDPFGISGIVDRLFAYVTITSGTRNNREICGLCLLLSRAIDDAVSNNEIPHRALELPLLLKQLRQWINDEDLLTAFMVLMISIKGACRNGWFSEKDNEELHTLCTETVTSFSGVGDLNSGESTVNHNISTVLARFYPRMKMGEIFTFIEAPPGYGTFVKDFHITKNAKSPGEEVYLFVAQTDKTETSSCIATPQLVSFLLNGKAVVRRTGIYKDPGPQIPTDITDLVRYGTTNLLQAVGQFNGKYIIVVALMSMITNPSCPALQDYVPPVAAAPDLDNDIVEGPSRISLNCPISFKRMTTPVKGHLCKHLQCFDYENYVDINSRRPSWRCPHCSQSVCFTDIRIDQKMAKVLKEVDVTISHVKFSADGSWKDVNNCDDHADEQQDKSLLHQKSNPSSDKGKDIMDLTEGGNDIDAHQEIDKKPSLAQLQAQLTPSDRILSLLNMNPVHTNTSPHIENPFSRQTHESVTSDTRSNAAVSQGQTVIYGTNNMQLPTQGIWTSRNPNSQGQSQSQILASSMQFQQNCMNNVSNDYGQRYTAPGRHVTRIPNAVQVHTAQTPAGMVSGDRSQQNSRSYTEEYQIMRTVAASNSSMFENMGSQNWVHHGLSNVSSRQAQQFGTHSGSFHQSTGHQFNSYQHQSVDHTMPNPSVVGPAINPVSNQQAHRYVGPTTSFISNQQAQNYVGPMHGSMSNQQGQHYVLPTHGSISNQQAQNYVGPMTGSMSNQQGQHYVRPTNGSISNQQTQNYVGPTPGSMSNQQGQYYVRPTNDSISNQQTHHYANDTAQQAFHLNGWTPPTPTPLPTSFSSMPVISSEEQRGVGQAITTQQGSGSANDQNWRPVGRMRGSLGDRAYSDAFSQSIIYPVQPVQAAASPPALNTPRPFLPPQLQVLVANNINANGLQEGANGSVIDGMSGGA